MTTIHSLCPYCGLAIFRNDAAQSIAHEDPACSEFVKLAESQPHEKREVQPEALEAHFSALARRVASKRKSS